MQDKINLLYTNYPYNLKLKLHWCFLALNKYRYYFIFVSLKVFRTEFSFKFYDFIVSGVRKWDFALSENVLSCLMRVQSELPHLECYISCWVNLCWIIKPTPSESQCGHSTTLLLSKWCNIKPVDILMCKISAYLRLSIRMANVLTSIWLLLLTTALSLTHPQIVVVGPAWGQEKEMEELL